jgi:nitrate/TMAO reductase-like tetraheme cytochrome c subunit
MVKYHIHLNPTPFLCNSYVKNKCHKLVKSSVTSILEFCVLCSTTSRLVKEVCSTGHDLEKKYTRQNTVITREVPAKIRVRFKHSFHKSLTQLDQKVGK